jgi:hypothetical protein
MCVCVCVCRQDDSAAHIDELLHAQILDTVTTHPPSILVLLSGDGNPNGGMCMYVHTRVHAHVCAHASAHVCVVSQTGRSSFAKCVVTAIRLGWKVEIYCWRHSTSSFFMAVESLAQGRCRLFFLDAVRETVSFPTSRLRTKEHEQRRRFLSRVAKDHGFWYVWGTHGNSW